ncbi:toxin VasX [Pseudomonas indica]|uniref:toxin VasX n=1 Tax=Pseudomonas indica TaxID=137658 RepID=UPI000BABCAFE|nr:toxin VasX [Pseudomonas indica]PAU60431.1 hypothetical protein BZL42_10405 [Pseudomonas indica]
MSAKAGSLSNGPACEACKLIVEVIGKDHPPGQRIVIYDETDNELQEWLTNRRQLEPLIDKAFSSTLHIWPWDGQPKRHLWLEIEAEKGGPIRVPLMDDAKATPRQIEQQWNQIVPVMPFTAVAGSRSAYDLGTPVQVRNGYVYVFYRDKLWRELEVRVGEKTTFHDVPVAHYRQKNGFKSGPRAATGKALDDIWLPATWNDMTAPPVQLCFSEVQLSASRLQRLEQDAGLRRTRCNSVDLRASKSKFKRLYEGQPNGKDMLAAFSTFDVRDYANQNAVGKAKVTRLNLNLHVFPVGLAAPQRMRQPGYEWMLDHPGRYLCDLSGQFPVTSKTEAQAFLDGCERGTPGKPPATLESDAWAHCLEEKVKAGRPVCPAPQHGGPSEVWKAQPAEQDVLQQARQRQICGVLLDDEQYRLRHLLNRINTQQNLLKLCAERATQHANHGSALLVQQLIVPRALGGQTNPLHQSLEKLKEQGKRDINRFTATPERAQVWRHLNGVQDLLAECLGHPEAQQTLADHLSLDGFDYTAALHFASQLLAGLACSPAQLDPLAVNGDVTDAITGVSLYSPKGTPGQQLISTIANQQQHPLHAMLWPVAELKDLLAPYQKPASAEPNQGDGRFRPSELAKAETQGAPAANQQTLDSSLLASLVAAGSLNSTLTAQLKAGAGALISIYENIQGAVDAAENALHAAKETSRQRQAEAASRSGAHQQARGREQATRESLGKRARPVNIRLHGQGVQQLRSMLPDTFGYAYFIRRSQANSQAHYLFGLEDLPTQPARATRFYGEFLDARGNLLGSTNVARGATAGAQTGDHLLLALPRNHSTARLIGELNRRINTAREAERAAQTAQASAAQADSALESAVQNYNTQRNSKVYRVLNSRTFTAAVLMLELWNVNNEWQSREQTANEKGGYRFGAGLMGAGLDLLIAMEALTVKLAGSQSVLASARRTLFTIPDKAATRWLGVKLGEQVTKDITARLIGQTIAGLVFAGLCLYDAWYAWQWNDDAMWGYLLMAGGGILGAASGLLAGSATFLGLNPVGWIALLLVCIGAGLVYLLSSSPIEDWLANGPFGDSRTNNYPHLRDPQEAFYRLVGLFAGIRISSGRNPAFDPNAKLSSHDTVPYRVRTANSLVRIESNLPGLLSSLGNVNINALCRLRSVETVLTAKGDSYTVAKPLGPEMAPVAQRLWPNALELFFDMPASQSMSFSPRRNGLYHEWVIRAQFRLSGDRHAWYFPTPKPKDPQTFNLGKNKPNWDKVDQPFWADERTYNATPPKEF